jgi:hypothetical protein
MSRGCFVAGVVQRTPGPYYVHTDVSGDPAIVSREGREPATDSASYVVSVARTGHNHPISNANAAFIVRACNAYDEMLAALRRVVEEADKADDWQPWAEQCRAAIAKAEA